MQEVLKMFKIHFSNTPTEKMSQQGTCSCQKKEKKTHLDSQIILQKEHKVYSAIFFFSFSTSCKYETTEQFYTACLSPLAKCGGLVENVLVK